MKSVSFNVRVLGISLTDTLTCDFLQMNATESFEERKKIRTRLREIRDKQRGKGSSFKPSYESSSHLYEYQTAVRASRNTSLYSVNVLEDSVSTSVFVTVFLVGQHH